LLQSIFSVVVHPIISVVVHIYYRSSKRKCNFTAKQ